MRTDTHSKGLEKAKAAEDFLSSIIYVFCNDSNSRPEKQKGLGPILSYLR